MKRLVFFSVIILVMMIAFSKGVECRVLDNLYYMMQKHDEVKTYVADIINSADNDQVDTEGLKKILENALAVRMTINFKLVPSKADADIIINCTVLESIWTDDDPIDMITGIAPVIMDAAKKENYARMQAVFTVISGAKNTELWRDRLKATITDEKMTSEDSVSMINEKLIKVFMRKCFSKPH